MFASFVAVGVAPNSPTLPAVGAELQSDAPPFIVVVLSLVGLVDWFTVSSALPEVAVELLHSTLTTQRYSFPLLPATMVGVV
jgi:hypothetical protein